MKLLASGDIHGDTRLAERLAQKATDENVDLVVLCGDLTMQEQSTDNIIGPFAKRGHNIILIPGNHETIATADFLAELYGATNLHGKSVVCNGVGLFGCGGANIGLFQLPENEIFDTLKSAHDSVKELQTKVMVTHVHPSGSLMGNFTEFLKGSEGVEQAIHEFKPDLLLCSHVHEAEGIEETIGATTVINVGKNGKIIEIN